MENSWFFRQYGIDVRVKKRLEEGSLEASASEGC